MVLFITLAICSKERPVSSAMFLIISSFAFAPEISFNSYGLPKGLSPRYRNLKRLGSLTESKFSCEWSIMSAFNYYCDRKFEKVDFSDEIYEKYFIDMDFEYFCTDEIVFNEDTLYFIIY